MCYILGISGGKFRNTYVLIHNGSSCWSFWSGTFLKNWTSCISLDKAPLIVEGVVRTRGERSRHLGCYWLENYIFNDNQSARILNIQSKVRDALSKRHKQTFSNSRGVNIKHRNSPTFISIYHSNTRGALKHT